MGPVLTYEDYTFLFFKTNIFLTNTIIQSTKIIVEDSHIHQFVQVTNQVNLFQRIFFEFLAN